MCEDSGVGYTGPYADLERCPNVACGKPRFRTDSQGKRVPNKTFYTFPIGYQIQAARSCPESCDQLDYAYARMRWILDELDRTGQDIADIEVFDDITQSLGLLEAVRNGTIGDHDTILLFSMDGAQLYRYKDSTCWIYIWVILNYSPTLRFKKRIIVPGGIIPGPNHPKHADSFLYPGFHHLVTLMKQGIQVWDARQQRLFSDHPFLAFATADTEVMEMLLGFVGVTGRCGCRRFCGHPGRHKPGLGTYYPAYHHPLDCSLPDGKCNHRDEELYNRDWDEPADALFERYVCSLSLSSDIDLTLIETRYNSAVRKLIAARNPTQFKAVRLETGLCKPSIFTAIPRSLGVPRIFPSDLMHLVCLNITDLLLSLWRGSLPCDPKDKKAEWVWAILHNAIWERHGGTVADATPYLPGSFDCPPRNPAEKVSSGYKAWEWLMYIFSIGPAVFYGVLPDPYYLNFCCLVRAVRILFQRRITRQQMLEAHSLLIRLVDVFERIYYRCKTSRLHFIRQCIHQLLHLATSIPDYGPGDLTAQWLMERLIGSLTREIRQPSKSFRNLLERSVIRAQVNALLAKYPELDSTSRTLPHGAEDLGDGYFLLHVRDNCERSVRHFEEEAIKIYLASHEVQFRASWRPKVER